MVEPRNGMVERNWDTASPVLWVFWSQMKTPVRCLPLKSWDPTPTAVHPMSRGLKIPFLFFPQIKEFFLSSIHVFFHLVVPLLPSTHPLIKKFAPTWHRPKTS